VGPGLNAGDSVQEQYERWVYPQPIDDLSTSPLRETFDPSLGPTHLAYWPQRAHWQESTILIAGCGANQAASIAYHNPRARVTGIDVSAASLAHAAYLKDKHALKNLELVQLPIEEAGKLDQRFDLILCVGVLHHLKSPAAGLRVLRDCLEPHGSIGIMLYGKYLRSGVYMLQQLFRRMGLKQTGEDLATMKQILAKLPSDHIVHSYIKSAHVDIHTDTGLIDTFLHPRDVAYSVADCLELVQRCGLAFQSWQPYQIHLYYPNASVAHDHPLYQWAERRDDPEVWAAMELFSCKCGTHTFIACRADRPESTYRVDVRSAQFGRLIPAWAFDVVRDGSDETLLKRERFADVPLKDWQAKLLRHVDGRTTLEDAMQAAGMQDREAAAEFIESLRRIGYLIFGLK
jgi:SAM-dependent methyltransferase